MADRAMEARVRAATREAHDAYLALEQATIYVQQGSEEARRQFVRIGHTHLLRASSMVNLIQSESMAKMGEVNE